MRFWKRMALIIPFIVGAATAHAVSRPAAGTDATLNGEPPNYTRTIVIVVAIVVAIVTALWFYLARNSRSGRNQ